VERLVAAVRAQAPELPGWAVISGVRAALAEARERASRGAAAPPPALAELGAAALLRAESLARTRPTRVINATGVALHTNLGRALLAPQAAAAAALAATRYGNLELDLATGRRGDRLDAVAGKLALLAGAEAALAVNNNAGALMLAVQALAGGREVLVSRGELIEIGGSFRLPDMIAAAGARLVEVGTTNRTHPEDYRRAIGPDTALLLKVHRSNFEVRGFTADVELPALAAIAHDRGLPLLEDLGSAALVDLRGAGLPEETYAPARLRLGADLVCFSGDKLFGGPQAGIVVGRADLVATLRRHPLARALRLDKMTIAALDWTASALLAGETDAIPVLRQLREPLDAVAQRAQRLGERIEPIARRAALRTELQQTRVPLGGGASPGFELPSWALALYPDALGANALAERLRRPPSLTSLPSLMSLPSLRSPPSVVSPASAASEVSAASSVAAASVGSAAIAPVIARVAGGAVLLDARTLLDDDVDAVAAALGAALADVAAPAERSSSVEASEASD